MKRCDFTCRHVMMKKKMEDEDRQESKNAVFLVWLGGTMDQLMENLGRVKTVVQPEAFLM